MIVVFGSINMDLVVRVPRLPLAGETLRGSGFFTVPGGKGANQAVATARLNTDVTLIGRVGRDELGGRAKAALTDEGVDTTHVTTDPDEPTGVALICVADDGENTIVTSGGANHRTGDEDLDALKEVLRRADMLLVQLEIGPDVVARAVELARRANVRVMLDPAPMAPLPDALLSGLDWITPNETEAEALTGHTDAAQAGAALRAKGVRNVVVTLGPDGCLAFLKDRGEDHTGDLHVAAPSVEAVDTVACGDAFNATLATALVTGAPVEEALQRACAAGALTATKPGAQTSLPTAVEIDRLLR